MKRERIRAVFVVGALALAWLAGCKRGGEASAPSPASAAATNDPPAIAKIVFIDQVDACECTRARVEKTWNALAAALGQPPVLPVERIHMDVQREQARAYTMFRPLMVAPGVYFVDARDFVVEMLQGEVTAEAIRAVLHRPGGAPVSVPTRSAAGHGRTSEVH